MAATASAPAAKGSKKEDVGVEVATEMLDHEVEAIVELAAESPSTDVEGRKARSVG